MFKQGNKNNPHKNQTPNNPNCTVPQKQFHHITVVTPEFYGNK